MFDVCSIFLVVVVMDIGSSESLLCRSSGVGCLWYEEDDENDKDAEKDGADSEGPLPSNVLNPSAIILRGHQKAYLYDVTAHQTPTGNTT